MVSNKEKIQNLKDSNKIDDYQEQLLSQIDQLIIAVRSSNG